MIFFYPKEKKNENKVVFGKRNIAKVKLPPIAASHSKAIS
ncbi:hypothetical protein EVA_12866 [gut metagenome]|uniref:Uncharacterized protein n=1 Tax=gut metagenome TaxID=749906 RepID=J9GB98_9ZZZZ